jgi:hypothetical protein
MTAHAPLDETTLKGLVAGRDTRRQKKQASELGHLLLKEIGVDGKLVPNLEKSDRFKRALTLWAMEFPLNIQWYETEIPKQQEAFDTFRHVSIVLGVATLVGSVALVFVNKAVTAAQLSVLVAGIFGVMQILAAAGDPKARLGGFRKARADLNESMFTFQESWRGRSIIAEGSEADPQPSPDFLTALYQEIRAGRKISREERDTFFATFKSGTEILGAASTALEAVRGRGTALASAMKEMESPEITRETAVATRIQELRNKLADATAQKEALLAKLKRLTDANADAKAIAEVQGKIDDAETDRFKTQLLLDLAVKSDVAHMI